MRQTAWRRGPREIIDASFTNLGGSILGLGSPTTNLQGIAGLPLANTFYPIALVNAITGIDQDPAQSDIDADFNSSFATWYFGTDANPPAGQVDFATIVLHEIGHGLGITGFFGATSNTGPGVFDRFVRNGLSQSLLDTSLFANPSAALGTQLTSDDLFFNNPAFSSKIIDGTEIAIPAKLYAPNPFEPASSIAHLDETTFPAGNVDSLMTPVFGNAEAVHDPGPLTRAILRDLGYTVTGSSDTDSDTLTDAFETQFGLDPTSSTGDNGSSGDPDGDGQTNAQEQAAGTHPRGFFTRFFAEGATAGGLSFSTRIATANPGTTRASVVYRFLKTDGTTVSEFVSLNGMTRHTLDVGSIAGMANAEFSTVCESDVQVVSDRTMEWDANFYGSHAETSIGTTAFTWNLAEGSTNGFNLFYLIQNPNATAANVTVTFLRPGGLAAIVRNYTVQGNSRFNIWVNQQDAALASTDVSAIVTSTNGVTIIVERAMYLDLPGQTFGAGHESAGVTAASLSWFFAEGATGSFFDLFILLSNPNATNAQVRADYLLPSGTVITKNYTILANSRFNIWVDLEDAQLADTAVSTTITVTNGVTVIAERAMWWNAASGLASWFEAHNSPGSTVTGTQWALADGEVGGARSLFTFILIANTSAFAGSVTVKILFEDRVPVTRTFALNANSRFNVDVGAEFPETVGKRFGAVITSQATGGGTALIVVERVMYSNASGIVWAAGTNALATRLAPAATKFVGTFAGSGSQTGTVEITIQTLLPPSARRSGPPDQVLALHPATATLQFAGGGSVALIGSYDDVTQQAVLSGGGYTFTGTYVANKRQLTGTFTGPTSGGVRNAQCRWPSSHHVLRYLRGNLERILDDADRRQWTGLGLGPEYR